MSALAFEIIWLTRAASAYGKHPSGNHNRAFYQGEKKVSDMADFPNWASRLRFNAEGTREDTESTEKFKRK
jgi:hypothetical protein